MVVMDRMFCPEQAAFVCAILIRHRHWPYFRREVRDQSLTPYAALFLALGRK